MDISSVAATAAVSSQAASSTLTASTASEPAISEAPLTMLVSGTFVATYDVQGSADGSDWETCAGVKADGTIGLMKDLTTGGAWVLHTLAPYYRVNVTDYTSGSLRARLVTGVRR